MKLNIFSKILAIRDRLDSIDWHNNGYDATFFSQMKFIASDNSKLGYRLSVIILKGQAYITTVDRDIIILKSHSIYPFIRVTNNTGHGISVSGDVVKPGETGSGYTELHHVHTHLKNGLTVMPYSLKDIKKTANRLLRIRLKEFAIKEIDV